MSDNQAPVSSTEQKKQKLPPILRHLIGVIALPIIPLYILGYRLVGIRASYRWGALDVRPTTKPTVNQFLFSRGFPMVVWMGVYGLLVLIFGSPN